MSWKRPDVFSRMRLFLESLPTVLTGYIIDMGTGDGVFAKLLREKYPRATLLKSDIQRMYYKDLIQHSITNPPFRRCAFGLVVIAQVVHYIPPHRWRDLIFRIGKSLEIEGSLVIIEYISQKSYSWLPYPVKSSDIEGILRNSSSLVVKDIIFDNDRRRPKYGIVIKKEEGD